MYAGALPTWMAPEQIRILTITDRAVEYAESVAKKLENKYRLTIDTSSNTLKYKIRCAQLEMIPYMLILGDKDIENGTVSVRTRTGEDLGALSLDAFEALIADVVDNKKRQ